MSQVLNPTYLGRPEPGSLRALGVLFVAVASLHCRTSLAPEDPVGQWTATTFALGGAVAGDVLAAGGSFDLSLRSNSTVTGRLQVPAQFAGGSAFDADMTGSWSRNGDTVRFVQSADTFVRDLDWIFDGANQMEASATFDGVTVAITLSRI